MNVATRRITGRRHGPHEEVRAVLPRLEPVTRQAVRREERRTAPNAARVTVEGPHRPRSLASVPAPHGPDDGTGAVWDLHGVSGERAGREDRGSVVPSALQEPYLVHRALVAVLVALLAALVLPVTPVAAATQAKVVVVVGPVGDHNAHYKDDANDIVDRGEALHEQRHQAVHAQRDLGEGQGRGAGCERVRVPRPRQRLAQHLCAVPDADEGRPRPRSLDRRGRQQDRLLRRAVHPVQHPPRAELGRPAVPPLLRLGQHRARAVAGHVRAGQGAGRQLRRRVHRRGRAGRVSRRATRRTPRSATCASCSRPTARWRRSSATAPTWHDNLYGPVRVAADAGRPVPARHRHRHAVGLLPLARSATCRSPRPR